MRVLTYKKEPTTAVVHPASPRIEKGKAGGTPRRKISENPYFLRYNQACESKNSPRIDVKCDSPRTPVPKSPRARFTFNNSRATAAAKCPSASNSNEHRQDCSGNLRESTAAKTFISRIPPPSSSKAAHRPRKIISKIDETVASSSQPPSTKTDKTATSTITETEASCNDIQCQDDADVDADEETSNHSYPLNQVLTTSNSKGNNGSKTGHHATWETISLLSESSSTAGFNSHPSILLPDGTDLGSEQNNCTMQPIIETALVPSMTGSAEPTDLQLSESQELRDRQSPCQSPFEPPKSPALLLPPLPTVSPPLSPPQSHPSYHNVVNEKEVSTHAPESPEIREPYCGLSADGITADNNNSQNDMAARNQRKLDRLRANNRRLLETTRQRLGKFNHGTEPDKVSGTLDTSSIFRNSDRGDGGYSNITDKTDDLVVQKQIQKMPTDEEKEINNEQEQKEQQKQSLLELECAKKRMAQMENELKRLSLANERLEVSGYVLFSFLIFEFHKQLTFVLQNIPLA